MATATGTKVSKKAKKEEPAPEQRNARIYTQDMRLGIMLPDNRVIELPRSQYHCVITNGRLLDVLPMTGYQVAIL